MRAFILLIAVFVSCSTFPSPEERNKIADHLAACGRWHKIILKTTTFDLAAYVPGQAVKSADLTIFIEGDGFSWISRSRPSTDPTPLNPVSLQLALRHPENNAAYLARPCQYVKDPSGHCKSKYWTDGRFSSEVVSAANLAISQLKRRFQAQRLTLVGYSGGAAVAALVASKRNDVERLVTCAGNLDHQAWSQKHQITPLKSSLNPVNYIAELEKIKQWHFVGQKDKNITPDLIYTFADRFETNKALYVIVLPKFDHYCCWTEHWPDLWEMVIKEKSNFQESE